MKVKSIVPIGKRPVYDISVDEAEHYVLENGAVTHNTGGVYSSDTIFILGKAKEKEGTELAGHKFTINIEKSRFVKEGIRFPFTVKYGSGIDKYSGLLDFALEFGHVVKSGHRLVRAHIPDDKKWWAKDTSCAEFWDPILNDTDFKKVVEEHVALDASKLFSDETVEMESDLLLEEEE